MWAGCAEADPPPPPKTVVTPAQARSGFRTAEELTRLEDVTNYNNFYEFGTDKTDPSKAAKTLKLSPWTVKVSGECEKPRQPVAGRTAQGHHAGGAHLPAALRGRLVDGDPVDGCAIGRGAQALRTDLQGQVCGVHHAGRPHNRCRACATARSNWPYREGLRIDEAMHPLTLLATGLYGKPLPQQNGAPLRLVVPWKYGFKSIKSIVEIRFVEKMPETAWHDLQPSEYGFFSNVNPAVDHPRWSQKTERRIAGTASKLFAERIATKPFNGYADQVASLYAGMVLKKWF